MTPRMLVLISGNRSNLQTLVDASSGASPSILNASIIHVISNKKRSQPSVWSGQPTQAYHQHTSCPQM
ncbi:hypothetical protein HOY82DRAFT_572943 [Tuber indicum]|nr:hypothetical protein HOY82DRAFT_572943 [Tuber indicum]